MASMLSPYYDHGGITIYHGDCREIMPTFADASIDLVLCDPPYGHNNNNGDLIHRREAALGRLPSGAAPPPARAIANDGEEANELVQLLFSEWRRLLKPGSCCCCCGGGGGPDPQFARWSLWLDGLFDFKQMVVWDKGPMGMGWHYRRSYETVLVAQVPGAACKWFDESNKVENIIRHIPKIIPQQDDHPTVKPIGLMCHFIALHTEPGQLILDSCMGEGTTLRAAKDLGRRAIGIELDERWCERAANKMRQEVLFA